MTSKVNKRNMRGECIAQHILSNKMVQIGKKVFNAARSGKPITLAALLYGKSDDEVSQILTEVHQYGQQKCTALVIAALHGNTNVVKLLLDQYHVDIEQTGTVQFCGFVIEGATALWTASGAGRYEVVTMLIERGADVNHATSTNSTPLRAACFDGRLDIVKYLVEHDADIHKPNKYNNTCLMIACYRGHLTVASYLLEHNADATAVAHCGATALHFTAETGHLEIVKELVKFSAQMIPNDHGMTPLMVACENNQAEVAEYIMTLDSCSKAERIEALELLGASYANDKDNYDVAKTYHYLYLALLERTCDPNNLFLKHIQTPISAYGYQKEAQTLEELKSLKFDTDKLHMEALIVRERILGKQCPELLHPIVYRGAVAADNMQFSMCLSLWKHALNIRQGLNRSTYKDLLRFAQVFSQMLHIGMQVNFSELHNILKSAVCEMESSQEKLNKCADKFHRAIHDSCIYTCLYLLAGITHKAVAKTNEQEVLYKKEVYQFLRLDPRTEDGSTPLHLVVNYLTPVDDFHTNYVCKIPSANLTMVLLQCGADPNAIDKDGNTPLHLIVKYNKPISDFLNLHAIIVLLMEANCHVDQVNFKGDTALKTSTTGVAEIILKAQTKPDLKCAAARIICKYNIPYKGSVPKSLECFIELHKAKIDNLRINEAD
ncbi:protein fem-1 homolog B-like [Anneissia japonica]|uniref:protein fem-1 homolog B-like n=1 Tax=Anneissia japonica TaxID=1529436 RepID=UPI0014256ECD|nr:protein fem-1 homolog B-like [Anneissia japonica]